MSGWIMPAPLAIPPTVIMPEGVSKRTAQCLGRVSVVMMASAASGAPSAFSPACAAAALKPRGDVTEPFGISVKPADIGGKIARACGLCNRPARHIIAQPSWEGPFDVGTVLELRRLRRTRASAGH